MSIGRVAQALAAGCLGAGLLLLSACESSDTLEGDAGKSSALDASSACNSPLHPVARGALPTDNGCSCAAAWAQPDYCINGWGLLCYAGTDNRWWTAADGTCTPLRDQAELVAKCSARRGILVERNLGCPTGFGVLSSSFEAAVDGGARQECCHPIDVTAQRCSEAGLQVIAAGTESRLLDTRCSNGGELRGFVTDAAEPSVCCAPR